MKKLAIVTTHPIQYYAPLFKLLNQRHKIEIKVFYTWGEKMGNKYDPGFKKVIEWDIPLLDGYPYEWVKNTSTNPGSHSFKGVITPELTGQIETLQPDAILVIGWGYHSHLKVMRHFKGKIPILFRGDSTLLDEKKNLRSLLRTVFLRWVYGYTDHAFYAGVNNKTYFKKYGLKDSQLSYTPHAIDNDRFAADRKSEAALLRKELGISDDEILIMFAGKLEEKKAPVQLLDAFLKLNGSSTHLLFVGNGLLEEQLKIKAKDQSTVHFMDFQNQTQIPVVYQACDLFCLPSKGPNETWGLAVNEAMACGKAVLVSDKVGCAADLVKEGVNGAIFKSGEPTSFSAKLGTLTEDKKLLLKYGQQSRIIISPLNFANIVKSIENQIINETH